MTATPEARSTCGLTTAQAREFTGLGRSAFSVAMTRARKAGVDCQAPRDQWPDARTPLWDADAVTAYLAGRSGRRTT